MNFFSKRETRNVVSVADQNVNLPMFDVFGNTFESDYASIDAMKNTDVITALHMISSDIAGLKLVSTNEQENEDLLKLLNKSPNNVMSGYSLKYMIVANLILDGNVFVEITRNENGRAIKLDLIPNSNVTINITKDTKHVKELTYNVLGNGDKTKARVIKAQDMLHFKMLSTDGIKGQSPLKALQNELSTDSYSKKFLNTFFKNGTHAGGILTVKNETLSDQAKKLIKDAWQKNYAGMNNSNSVIVLDEDFEYKQLQVDTELIKIINNNTTSKNTVAQVLGIPLHKMGLSTSNMDLAQLNQDYLISTLKSYLDIIIAELYKLDTMIDVDFDFNTDAYKNIDTKQMHENVKIERELGLISVDEARIKLGYAPLNNEIGEQHITNLNFVPSDIAKEYQLNKTDNKGGDTVNE